MRGFSCDARIKRRDIPSRVAIPRESLSIGNSFASKQRHAGGACLTFCGVPRRAYVLARIEVAEGEHMRHRRVGGPSMDDHNYDLSGWILVIAICAALVLVPDPQGTDGACAPRSGGACASRRRPDRSRVLRLLTCRGKEPKAPKRT
jgi:hypothetical protein